MEMSIREARAHFAKAIEAAQRGERVTITKNGKPVAELGPARDVPQETFMERVARVSAEMGLDKIGQDHAFDDKWLEEFNDPAPMRELFGLDRDDDDEDALLP